MPKQAKEPTTRRTSKPRSKSPAVRKKAIKSSSRVANSTSTKVGSASSKQARVIAMVQSPGGATIDAIVQQTGWQPHSVRGFLAGVVRKKLKLNLQSDKIAGSRVYRIGDEPQTKSAGLQTKSAGAQTKTDARRPTKRRSA